MSSDGTGSFIDLAAAMTRRFTRLAEELSESSRANRELVMRLVAGEAEKFADQVGLARQDEIDALRREIADLRIALAHQTARLDEMQTPPRSRTAAKKTAKKSTPRAPGTRASTRKAPST